jgi:hypothetical protein
MAITVDKNKLQNKLEKVGHPFQFIKICTGENE